MKKRKLELYITGKLMSALMVGRPAIFSTGGEMYHTAPVVKIHETEGKLKSVLSRSYSLCSYCPMRFWKSTMVSARTVSL